MSAAVSVWSPGRRGVPVVGPATPDVVATAPSGRAPPAYSDGERRLTMVGLVTGASWWCADPPRAGRPGRSVDLGEVRASTFLPVCSPSQARSSERIDDLLLCGKE